MMDLYKLYTFAGMYCMLLFAEFALAAMIFGNVKKEPPRIVGIAVAAAMFAFPAWLAWGMSRVAIYAD